MAMGCEEWVRDGRQKQSRQKHYKKLGGDTLFSKLFLKEKKINIIDTRTERNKFLHRNCTIIFETFCCYV
jgi:hypothetical protein